MPMSRKKLLAHIVLYEISALGVFFGFLMAWIYGHGGSITLDMTLFNEAQLEYWVLMAIMALTPWAVYELTD